MCEKLRQWLVAKIAARELAELENYRAAVDCAETWLFEFPDAVTAAEYVRRVASGEWGYVAINIVRKEMRRRRGA